MMALAWSLRGQFGHLKGALIPGAAAAILVSFLGKDQSWRETFGRAVILGSLGFACGGHLGYGKIIDFVIEQPRFWQETAAFAKLFWIGALWGGLGGLFLGFAYSEKPVRFSDILLFALFAAVSLLFLGLFNFDSWDWPVYGAAILIFHLYNIFVKKSFNVFAFGLAGLLGSGAGFVSAVAVLAAGHQHQLGIFRWWEWRDQIWGACTALALLTASCVCEKTKNYPSAWPGFPPLQKEGFLTLSVFIPFLNTIHVFLYWIEHPRRVYLKEVNELWLLFAGLGVLFLIEFFLWLRADEKIKFKLDRLMISAPLLFFWYFTFLAIAKERIVFGPGRWESGYTLFLLFCGALTVLLPFHQYRRDNR